MIDRNRALTMGGVLLLFAVFAAAITLVVGSLGSGGTVAQDDVNQRTVNVTGSGQVSVEPDTGLATVGVEVRDADIDAALALSNETVHAVIAAIQAQGVAEDDIHTSNFSIWPEYNWESENRELIAYNVNNSISFKVRDMNTTGDVVAAAVDAGANLVHSISFTLDDTSAAASQARELAVQNAQEKAEELAGLANASLGQVITISEQSFTPVPFAAGEAVAEDSLGAPPLLPGDLTVSVTVNVSWELQ